MINQVVIIFVPAGAAQREIAAALREHAGARPAGEPPPQAGIDQTKLTDNDQLPLWTWFLPNSFHQS